MVTISSQAEQNISQILQDVRRQSDASQTSQTGLSTVDSCESMTSIRSSSLAVTLSGQSSSTCLSSMDVVDGPSGNLVVSTALDERLREELLEKQRSNRTYQTMMVGLSLTITHARMHLHYTHFQFRNFVQNFLPGKSKKKSFSSSERTR